MRGTGGVPVVVVGRILSGSTIRLATTDRDCWKACRHRWAAVAWDVMKPVVVMIAMSVWLW